MPNPTPKPAFREPDETDKPDRLISLSDGIFGFAMTLLAINVALPEIGRAATPAQVTEHVLDLLPEFIVFATSFLLVGMYWVVHRRAFRYIIKTDATLTWLNLLQLLFVAFLPVATGLYDTFNFVPIVGLVYGSTLVVIGVIGHAVWRHATKGRRLVQPDLDPELVRYFKFRGELVIAIFVLFTILGYLSPEYGLWVPLLLLVTYPFIARAYRFLRQRNLVHIESVEELTK